MQKIVLVLMSLLLLGMETKPKPSDDVESAAIRNAAMDYVEGWYQADAERMSRSLHPDLAKRHVRQITITGRPVMAHISKSTLVEYTVAGGGKETPKDKLFYDVSILDVQEGIATVKAVSANYVDYLHLARWNDKWLIINILWENR